MLTASLFSEPPFDRLTPDEAGRFAAALNVEFFPAGATIITPGAGVEHLFIVIKGAVEELAGDELLAVYGPDDSFDSRALVEGSTDHAFVAREETLCHLAPRANTLQLARRNPRFGVFFYRDLSRKLEAMVEDQDDQRVGSLLRARVRDAHLAPAIFIQGSDTIEHAGHTMRDNDTNALFVRDRGANGEERIGIVTGMNLSKACVLRKMPITAAVRDFAHWDVVSISPDAFIFDAMVLMTKHNKRRLAVVENDVHIGLIDEIDLLGLLSSNSMVIAGRIDRAASVADLQAASAEIATSVRRLRRQGMQAATIAEITSDLNRRLFSRLFDQLAPPEIRAQGCLIVMGSEGRGEQTVRSDQDNGLILREPVDPQVLDGFRRAFSETLGAFGFPPCPGGVMVSNPEWSRTLGEFRASIRAAVATPDERSHLTVAILTDAQAVGGQRALMDDLRAYLLDLLAGADAFMAHFSRAIDTFNTPLGLFQNLIASEGAHRDQVDLKKGGVFPIVHGVRCLALKHRIAATGTVARIEALAAAEALDPRFAADLASAFHVLMDLRLDAQLRAEITGESGSLVRPADLTTLERQLLKDIFATVKQLREIIRHSFRPGGF
jgi:CBS domain-containing protein